MVDTGTNRTIVDTGLAQRLELRNTGRKDNVGAPGGVSGTFVVEARLSIDRLSFKAVEARVFDYSPYSEAFNITVGGILGTDFLRDYPHILINYPRKQIAFLSSPPTVKGLARQAVVPFRIEQDLMLAKVKFPGGVETELIFDNGHEGDVLVFADIYSDLKLEGQPLIKPFGDASGTRQLPAYKLPWIEFDDRHRVPCLIIAVHPNSENMKFKTKFKPGLLGAGVVERYVVEIDYDKFRMMLYQVRPK